MPGPRSSTCEVAFYGGGTKPCGARPRGGCVTEHHSFEADGDVVHKALRRPRREEPCPQTECPPTDVVCSLFPNDGSRCGSKDMKRRSCSPV